MDSVQVNRNKWTENVKHKFIKMALVYATIIRYYMFYMEKWEIPLNLGVTANQKKTYCGGNIQEWRHIPSKWPVCLCANSFLSVSKKRPHKLTTFWRTCIPQPPRLNELLRIKCKEIFYMPPLNHKKAVFLSACPYIYLGVNLSKICTSICCNRCDVTTGNNFDIFKPSLYFMLYKIKLP